MKYRLPVIIMITLLSGCVHTKLTNEYNGKYKYAEFKNPSKILDVNVGVMPIEQASSASDKDKTIFDLTADGQKAYIEAISSKLKNTKDIIKVIQSPLSLNTPEKKVHSKPNDQTKVNLIFSNVKKYFDDEEFVNSHTRLVFLNTTIKIDNQNDSLIKFYSIDKIDNEIINVDLGGITRTNGSVFDSNINVTGPQSTGNGGVKYTNSDSITENINLKPELLKKGYSFSPEKITISQRGAQLKDISDNVLVSITMKGMVGNNVRTRKVYFLSGYNDNLKISSFKDLEINKEAYTYLPCRKLGNVKIKVSYEGLIRAAENKPNQNESENNDNITYYNFHGDSNDIDVNKGSLCNNVYETKIHAKFEGDSSFKLYVRDSSGNYGEFLLMNDTSAVDFIDWLQSLINEGDVSKFKVPKNHLSLSFILEGNKQKEIKVFSSDFNQKDFSKLKAEINNIEPINVDN
ncbi:hypothetical protein ACX1NX_01590 [Acinetobacter sp. ANC 5383]